jgi:predicted transcriptional regulator
MKSIVWEKESPLASGEKAGGINLMVNRSDVGNSHRGNLDIIADILDASHGGVKKTYLMYRCNLSFKQLRNYSHFLLSSGLLHIVTQQDQNDHGLFVVTTKGKEFLRAYRGLKDLMR